MIFDVGGPPPKLDPIIFNNLTRTDFGGYAPNPRKSRRNQAEDTRATEKALAALEGPKFLSEKAKDGAAEDGGRRMSEILDQLSNSSLDGVLKVDVPVMYRNVEIKYSKFGVEDFDFEYEIRTYRVVKDANNVVGTITKRNTQVSKLISRTHMLILCCNC